MAKPFAKSFYTSSAWRHTRRLVLHRDHYTCADCDGRANEVHHIIELTPDNIHDPKIALNPDNLISLCSACHKRRTLNRDDLPEGYIFDEHGQVVRR